MKRCLVEFDMNDSNNITVYIPFETDDGILGSTFEGVLRFLEKRLNIDLDEKNVKLIRSLMEEPEWFMNKHMVLNIDLSE